MIVKELVTQLKFKLEQAGLNQYQQGIKKVKNDAQKAGNEIKHSLDDKVGGALVGLRTKLLGLFGGLGAGYGLKSIIDTSAEFERFETILGTIQGSAAKAKESMAWISDFAAKTPYDLAGVTDAFVKLKAYGIDPVANGMLTTLGDTSAAMGKPLMQGVEAIADAMTGEFERLKEFGIKGSGKGSMATFTYTDSKGKQQSKQVDKNNRELIAKTLQAIWNEKYAGAMDKLSGTWEGMVSNLGDQWDRLKLEIGKAGIFDGAKDALKTLLDWLGKLDAKDLKEIAESIVTIMKLMGGAALAYALTVWQMKLSQILTTQKLIAAWQAITSARAGRIAGIFTKWALILGGLYLIGDDILTWLQGGKSVLGGLIGRSSEWKDKIEWVKESFKGVVTWLRDGGAKMLAWVAYGAAVASVFYTIWRVVSMILGVFKAVRVVMGVMSIIAGGPIVWAIAAIAAACYLVYKYWDDIKAAAIAAWNSAKGAWEGFKAAVFSGINWLIGKWTEFKNMLANPLTAVVNFVTNGQGTAQGKMQGYGGGRGGNYTFNQNVQVNGAKSPATTGKAVASSAKSSFGRSMRGVGAAP